MLQNYLKLALRSMIRQRMYALINIIGLAVGLTSFILIFLFVRHELSFDRFYPGADRIYRVYKGDPGPEYLGKDFSARTPAGLASALVQEFPEVEFATTLESQTALLGFNQENHYENGILADGQFFKVFPLHFLAGDPQKALESPESIVLNESLAKKIFGEEDPLGQTIAYQDGGPYTVTGIMEDLPSNSSFKFSFVRSILSLPDYIRDRNFAERWFSNSAYTFFRLAEGASAAGLEGKLPALLEKYKGDDTNLPFEIEYFIQPLANLHLENRASEDIGLKGNPRYVRLFALIAILVLILACANYMNLAIARMIGRVGEVGLRKTIGASRKQLAGQFLGESILNAFLGLLLALALTQYFLPVFGRFLQRPITLNYSDDPWLLPGLLLLVMIVGILSGSYPAFYLSSLRPVAALKGKADRRLGGIKIQRWLLAGQYMISIALMASSVVIYKQFRFIQNKELGYSTEHIVTIPIRDQVIHEKIDLLKNQWVKHPGIIMATASSSLPTHVDASRMINYDYETGGEQAGALKVYRVRVDEEYLEVFNIDLLAGRNFSPDRALDKETGRIINETAAKALGWTAKEAVGKKINDLGQAKTVIGVMKDIHMHSMHQAIEPLMLTAHQQYQGFVSVKIRPANLGQTIDFLEESFQEHTAYPFEYHFLDDRFDQLYQADRKLGEMFGVFTLLSILIASLGLFGLAAFVTNDRTKEIGIRKVLGASEESIVFMLSGDFLKMVFLGLALAIPIAWYGMNRWLQGFAYHIDLQWWMFGLSGLVTLLIAISCVSFQSLVAAWANPVDSLRND